MSQKSGYECAECSVKPGSPTLCARCVEARAKAGNRWQGTRPSIHEGSPPMLEGLPIPRCPGCGAEGEKSSYHYERVTFVDMKCGVCSHRYRLHRVVVLSHKVRDACNSKDVNAKIALVDSILEQIDGGLL